MILHDYTQNIILPNLLIFTYIAKKQKFCILTSEKVAWVITAKVQVGPFSSINMAAEPMLVRDGRLSIIYIRRIVHAVQSFGFRVESRSSDVRYLKTSLHPKKNPCQSVWTSPLISWGSWHESPAAWKGLDDVGVSSSAENPPASKRAWVTVRKEEACSHYTC